MKAINVFAAVSISLASFTGIYAGEQGGDTPITEGVECCCCFDCPVDARLSWLVDPGYVKCGSNGQLIDRAVFYMMGSVME